MEIIMNEEVGAHVLFIEISDTMDVVVSFPRENP